MIYCFARYKRSKTPGWEPDLPRRAGFLLLADPGWPVRWGVFEIGAQLSDAARASLRLVPSALALLLVSGTRYPPALALAREEMSSAFRGRRPTRAQFVARYAAAITAHLRRQPRAPYRLAEALGDQIGYLTKGQFYWVLGYHPRQRIVAWVSDDFFVYHNPSEHFRLSRAALRELTRRRQ